MARRHGLRVVHLNIRACSSATALQKMLLNGWDVAGRHYACTWVHRSRDNQKRGNQDGGVDRVLMYAESGQDISPISVADMLAGFGTTVNSTMAGSAAKASERLSMLGCNAVAAMPMHSRRWTVEQDVLSESGEVMTDGCGLISREFLGVVFGESAAKAVTALQVRAFLPDGAGNQHGGAFKGLLVASDSLPRGLDIMFRKSMHKLEAARRTGCQAAVASMEIKAVIGDKDLTWNAKLNKQLIRALHAAGVPEGAINCSAVHAPDRNIDHLDT